MKLCFECGRKLYGNKVMILRNRQGYLYQFHKICAKEAIERGEKYTKFKDEKGYIANE